jgi:hypothetical protein
MIKITGSYDFPSAKARRCSRGIASRVFGAGTSGVTCSIRAVIPCVVDPTYSNNLRGGTALPNVLTNDWIAASTAGDRFDPSVDNFFNINAFQRRTNPAADPSAMLRDSTGRPGRSVHFEPTCPLRSPSRSVRRCTATSGGHIRSVQSKDLGQPTTDLSSNQFGIITTANGNRTMQLGLKLVF